MADRKDTMPPPPRLSSPNPSVQGVCRLSAWPSSRNALPGSWPGFHVPGLCSFPTDQGALPSKATSPLVHPGPTLHSPSPGWSQPASKVRGPQNNPLGGKGAQEALACPLPHCSPSPSRTEPWPLTVGSVWTETMSSGLTSCGSSEGAARPRSFCLEGKECLRQSPPQPVCGSAGSQRGLKRPDSRVLTPRWQPCAPIALSSICDHRNILP